jgi:glycerol-3-phosphate dehydrogenase
MIASMGKSGSHFFVIPWRNHTLIGTTDKEYIGDPDEYKVTRQAILELIDEVNSGFGNQPLEYKDVLYCYGGLRPLVEDQTKGSYESSRKYEIFDNGQDGFEGLITVEGGKYTTSRNLAENALKLVAAKLNRDLGKCTTAQKHLAGCEIDDLEKFIAKAKQDNPGFDPKTIDWLARHYGTDYPRVLALARENKPLAATMDGDGELFAQVLYATKEEMALTLTDIIFRRTGIGTLGNPGNDKINLAAELAAKELGWDAARKEKEIVLVMQKLKVPE